MVSAFNLAGGGAAPPAAAPAGAAGGGAATGAACNWATWPSNYLSMCRPLCGLLRPRPVHMQ